MFTWFRRWSLLKKTIVGVPSFIIAIVASMIATGAYPIIISVLLLVLKFIIVNFVFCIIILVSFACFFVLFAAYQSMKGERDNLKASLDGKNKLFRVVDSLLRLLPSLVSTKNPNKKEEIHRLMRSLLANTTKVIPQVYGASLFLPDAKGEELTIWESHGVPGDSAARARCYIGSTDVHRKNGIAGEAFIKREIVVTHLVGQDEDGQWKFDKPSYIDFTEESTYPTFHSLVCVPIVIGAGSNDCLGVICLDSASMEAFDPPGVQELLKLLARYLASAVLICQEVQKD